MSQIHNKIVVTIDGPSASGKTSVSRELARQFGWAWVSTGAFYRGVAYVALHEGIDLKNEQELVKLIDSKEWKVVMAEQRTQFFYKERDVTEEIYKEEIGSAASLLSQHPLVRKHLLEAQRSCLTEVKGLVAEGRDCGTVVFPEAQIKVYLTARSDHRAARRATEEGGNVKLTLEAQKRRDQQDSSRSVAPLQVPENAHVVDTSEMNLEQVVESVVGIVNNGLNL